MWPLWRQQLLSLYEWSHGLPSAFFKPLRFLFQPSVLGATLAMIYFSRTSSKTSISRKPSVIVFFLQQMIASDDFEKQLFHFLWGVLVLGSACRRMMMLVSLYCPFLEEMFLDAFVFPRIKMLFFIIHSWFVKDVTGAGGGGWGGSYESRPSAFGLLFGEQQEMLSLCSFPYLALLCLGSIPTSL